MAVNVLCVGIGGREHAIALKLLESPKVKHVFCAPGNGGTALEPGVTNVAVGEMDIQGLVRLAKEKQVGLVFVGPQEPLCEGLTDAMAAAGVPCFGPSKAAAHIEASKAWSKDFFAKYDLPTATYKIFQAAEYEAACRHVEAEYAAGREVVVKASGLAGGKGALVPTSLAEALAAVREVMLDKAFGAAGDEVVIEELLVGEEVSCMAFCDGATATMLVPAQDHKRALDNDEGLNTGGMGAYAPAPCLTPKLRREVEEVLQRTVEALDKEGRRYVGVLYGGFMLTKDGPKLLEYNCRLGDPESQAIVPLLESDLFEIAMGCILGNLKALVPEIRWRPGAAATVICAARGYPASFPKGMPVSGADAANALEGVKVYHGGTKSGAAGPVNSGGRVVSVTGLGGDIREALKRAYAGCGEIRFEGGTANLYYRRDIGRKATERAVRVGLVGSGDGADAQGLLDAVKAGRLQATAAVAVSSRADAGLLSRAKSQGVPAVHLASDCDAALTAVLRDHGVDLVVLLDSGRAASPSFCKDWEGACVAVSDLKAHGEAAEPKDSGCVVHMVTDVASEAPVVKRSRVTTGPQETPESLRAKLQAERGEALAEAVRLFGVFSRRASERTHFKSVTTGRKL